MHLVRLTPLIALFASAAASGGTLTVTYLDLNEGHATALLEASSQRQVDAMRRLVAERYPGNHTARRWEEIEMHMRDVPLARVEYEYTVGDEVVIRTYHAAGGEPLGRVASRAFDGVTPSSRPGTPESPGWSEGEDEASSARATFTDEELAGAEAADERFYVGFDDVDLRAPFRIGGTSRLPAYWYEGRYHALDAEQKALRAIEDDILTQKIPRGGTVRGLLSSSPCATCQAPIQRFAETYELNITLTGMSPGIPVRVKDELIRSGKARMKGLKLVDVAEGRPVIAFDVLAGARDAQVRQNLSPAALERASTGVPWQGRSFRLGAPRPPRISEGSDTAPGSSPEEPGTLGAQAPDC